MQSKITGGDTTLLFTARVLNKYDVKYYRCNQTGFIQTEEPYWLEEAYSSAITQLDIGLPYRNINLAERVSKLLIRNFNYEATFLDYAGGYGLFTRLMRDKGFNFYHTDQYCQNLFAEHFELTDLPPNTKFELVTAFEVFEHLPNPLAEIKQMLEYTDNLLFSTELQPDGVKNLNDWAYFATETGQHIAFYNQASLKAIATQLGYNFYTDGSFLHLFTKATFANNPLAPVKESFLLRKAKKFIAKAERKLGMPDGLLMRDWKYIKDKLNG
jgi:2-polyprenyl-3-methyl-5-hydroxy-6-metoxy-1,4-benzoquinol methylase